MADLATTLWEHFTVLGYEWRKNDGEVIKPIPADFREAIDKAKEALYDEPVPSQASFGGLIVRRTAPNTFAIYLQIGIEND